MPWDAKGENNKRYDDMKKTEEKVKTARAPSSAHLLIDSLDRYQLGYPRSVDFGGNQTSSSSWTLQLPTYVLNGYFTRLSVTQIQFEWNIPTIVSGYNDQLTCSVTSGIYTIQLVEGWYTPTTLATAITTEFAALTPPPTQTITCTYSPTFGAFVLSASAGAVGITSVTSVRNGRFGITSGLLQGSERSTDGLNTIGSPPTMLATRFIDIRSSYLTKNQRVKDVTTLPGNIVTDVIARVYAVAPNTSIPAVANTVGAMFSSPWIMNISYPVPKYIRWNMTEPISNFTLELLDDGGNTLPWTQGIGCEYSLTMIASED
jgi:hypothetical protein